ncbi:MAG: hypothetical protein R2855_09780 [Thermomicrobiales bacterium]
MAERSTPRLWWILYQLGHADIRILNGGLPAWTAFGGGNWETGATTPTAAPGLTSGSQMTRRLPRSIKWLPPSTTLTLC